jgi:hypothetical protein
MVHGLLILTIKKYFGIKYLLTKIDIVFGALIILISVLIYANSLFGGFIWDDRAAVV